MTRKEKTASSCASSKGKGHKESMSASRAVARKAGRRPGAVISRKKTLHLAFRAREGSGGVVGVAGMGGFRVE